MTARKKSTPKVTDEAEGTSFIYVRGYAGFPFKLDLPLHAEIEEQLSKGYLTRVANLNGDPVPDEDAPPATPDPAPPAPAAP